MSFRMKRLKYQPLEDFLKSKREKTIKLTFNEIESILGKKLPPSASKYLEFWSNGSRSHDHANSWLNAGYTVSEKELGKYVVFVKG